MADKLANKYKLIVLETAVKERAFDHDPRRHFQDKRQGMVDDLVAQLIAAGCLKEETIPTATANEYKLRLTLEAKILE